MDRRLFLITFLGLLAAGASPAGCSFAKDGRDDDDDDDGDDDNDDHDDDEDDDEEDDRSSSNSGRGGDHQKAREAVGLGRILPLRDILKRVDELGGGRVISVDLNLKTRSPYYTLKVQSGSRVRTLKLDAVTGRKLTLFGW